MRPGDLPRLPFQRSAESEVVQKSLDLISRVSSDDVERRSDLPSRLVDHVGQPRSPPPRLRDLQPHKEGRETLARPLPQLHRNPPTSSFLGAQAPSRELAEPLPVRRLSVEGLIEGTYEPGDIPIGEP